jgi:peptidoglycan hydrolase-like protein with peptidoglycan-binding domain
MTIYPLKAFVKDIQAIFDVEVTGVAGSETLAETITLSEVLNRKHQAIYVVQKRLAMLGYAEVGKVNGVAGAKFTSAVKHFQVDNGCIPTGEITARDKTWKKLLGME